MLLLLCSGCSCKADRAPPRVSRDSDAGELARPRTPVPIVDATHDQLFGAVRGDEWLQADRAAAFAEEGTPYRLYTLARFLCEAVGHAAAPPRETCGNPTVVIEGVPPATEDVIAIAGSWNALRRVPRRQEPTSQLYRESVAAWLRARGIDEPEVNLTQLLRVDLEGDGVEEVLIAANHMAGLGTLARAGDYGLVLLRKVVEGE
ncbi:MAG TPA: hypothetical protein VLQ93_05340, partial [Myxococcaceae bacterium]|nr:hypothetical protein [Myxococcaceae bacterium]